MKVIGSYHLDCQYDSRQSFYGKAIVTEQEDELVKSDLLFSYGTLVAIYTRDKITGKRLYDYLGKYSQTTTRHQKEFFKQHGLWGRDLDELFKQGHLEIGA